MGEDYSPTVQEKESTHHFARTWTWTLDFLIVSRVFYPLGHDATPCILCCCCCHCGCGGEFGSRFWHWILFHSLWRLCDLLGAKSTYLTTSLRLAVGGGCASESELELSKCLTVVFILQLPTDVGFEHLVVIVFMFEALRCLEPIS